MLAIPNNHLSYALTWFGLALGLVGVYVAFVLRQRRGTGAWNSDGDTRLARTLHGDYRIA